MKIQKLIIKSFGKFTDKSIEVSDGINLFYGENESGKSTVHTFIKGMLFGMERGRGRAAANDTFSHYEPWENPNYYSGSLKFGVGGKTFCIQRNFDKYSKKAELICEDDGEELSVEDGDLEMLLLGLKETGYENTIAIGQLRAEPGQSLAAELKNYATNYCATGNGGLNLEAALTSLRNRKKELDKEAKEELVEKQRRRERMEQETSYVWRDIHRLQEENDRIAKELEYRINKQVLPQNKRVIDELRPAKWRIHPVEIVLFALVVTLAFIFIHRPWNYLVAIVLFLLCGIYVWNRLKVGKKQVKTEPEILLEEITPDEEKIPMERLRWEKNHIEGELKDKQVQYDNLQEQLEEMDEISEAYKEQSQNRQAVQLAIDRLNELSSELQAELEQQINSHASEILSFITGGKYTRLIIEDNLCMSLLAAGKKIPIDLVSRGTIEQIYFAMRMAAAELLHEEEYPVILDDTFVFYDDIRLKNTLKWLVENKEQVLLFTCQKREEAMLRELHIPYHIEH